MRELMERLKYRFRDEGLLQNALTTPAYAAEKRLTDYQRLEFLGDAVLQLAISRTLFDRYPAVKEGKLTFARSKLVREETLYEAGRRIGLHPNDNTATVWMPTQAMIDLARAHGNPVEVFSPEQ